MFDRMQIAKRIRALVEFDSDVLCTLDACLCFFPLLASGKEQERARNIVNTVCFPCQNFPFTAR